MTIKAASAMEGKAPTPYAILASGELLPVAAGIMEGTILFPVRGSIKCKLERRPNDRHGGGEAELYCQTSPPSGCGLSLIEASIEDGGHDYWHGFLQIEGYFHRVRGVRDGKRMLMTLFDAKQPLPVPDWKEAPSLNAEEKAA